MGKNGLEQYFVTEGNKKLYLGYTTGSCAAAAAKAATWMLFLGQKIYEVNLATPKGIVLHLPIEEIQCTTEYVSCAVRKDAGDDPDVTDGILVYAKVKKIEQPDVVILGGTGVGIVTRKGLEQPVGEAAINRVPRKMIKESVEEVLREQEWDGGIEVEISVPEGVNVAKKTFNERLGIQGGISILGTSGIVVPMSEKALIDSIRVEMKMLAAEQVEYLLITPGNYGETFVKNQMQLDLSKSMKCSNYVGETIGIAKELGIKGILFVSHIGKFIKVSGGIMNTHSKHSDSRAELMTAAAIRAGASIETARRLLDTITTEEAVTILKEGNLLSETMKSITDKIHYYLNKKSGEDLKIGAILFSNEYGYLGETKYAKELAEKFLNKRGE